MRVDSGGSRVFGNFFLLLPFTVMGPFTCTATSFLASVGAFIRLVVMAGSGDADDAALLLQTHL